MKKIILFVTLAIVIASCSSTKYVDCDAYSSNGIIIKPTGDNEGRPYYSVYMSDGTIHEYMYAEEIARGLLENNWTADEDLILAYANQD
jgi:hypothetical protein